MLNKLNSYIRINSVTDTPYETPALLDQKGILFNENDWTKSKEAKAGTRYDDMLLMQTAYQNQLIVMPAEFANV